MSRTAVVAGATGLVGGMLLKQLSARREYGEVERSVGNTGVTDGNL